MQEPTEAEMIRALGVKIDDLTHAVNGVRTLLGGYVTKERYEAEMVLRDHKHDQLVKEVEEGKGKVARAVNIALSSFIAPVIVGLVMWLLIGGK